METDNFLIVCRFFFFIFLQDLDKIDLDKIGVG
jgi:hypothetical protein